MEFTRNALRNAPMSPEALKSACSGWWKRRRRRPNRNNEPGKSNAQSARLRFMCDWYAAIAATRLKAIKSF
jgi:hypothetical protein